MPRRYWSRLVLPLLQGMHTHALCPVGLWQCMPLVPLHGSNFGLGATRQWKLGEAAHIFRYRAILPRVTRTTAVISIGWVIHAPGLPAFPRACRAKHSPTSALPPNLLPPHQPWHRPHCPSS